jgi:hypothetical protein
MTPLDVLERSMALAYGLAERANQSLQDAIAANDPALILSCMGLLNDHLKVLTGTAEKAAPYRHRRLAGERPLEDDQKKGPAVIPMSLIEQSA